MNQETQQTQSHHHLDPEKSNERWNLLWGVRRSIRYHDRRRRFFDTCHRIVLRFGIVLATIGFAVANETINEDYLVWFSVLSMFAFLLDLLIGFSNRVWHYTTLKRRFGELEKNIITGDERDDMAPLEAQRLEIEKDEPPILRALDILCHNELAQSMEETNENIYKVNFVQRITAQLFTWPNIQAQLIQQS